MFPQYLPTGPADFAHFASNAMAVNFVLSDKKPTMNNYRPQMPNANQQVQSTSNSPPKHSVRTNESIDERGDEAKDDGPSSFRRAKRKPSRAKQ
jgi:hypothetical protein